jgi:hypothetical protein
VGVAEKHFCFAKTFGARGSSVRKGLSRGAYPLPSIESMVLPLLNLLTVDWLKGKRFTSPLSLYISEFPLL